MARRRKKHGMALERTQDPGKDLFAYLFLLIMVFSFMLLMSIDEQRGNVAGQQGPRSRDLAPHSTIASVSSGRVGRLSKKDGRLVLVFEGRAYRPREDLERLERDGRIAVIEKAGGDREKTLYLEERKDSRVLLHEYLSAFQYLNRRGIGVTFAERVK